MTDAYEACAYVKHYVEKNGYALKVDMLDCTPEEVDKLVANGILELRPLFEGGPAICVCLTEKGLRMAADASEHWHRTRRRKRSS